MKKSILICLMLSGGVAAALSVFGHRDDAVRAAVGVREAAGGDTPAPVHIAAVQNARLIFQLGEQKQHSVACVGGKYSLLHREGNHGLFELNGTLSTLSQDERLMLTYKVSWEFSEHHKETTDHVEESEVTRAAHAKDGAFAVSGNVAIRPGKTYTLGSFGETKLTVRVVVGDEEGGAQKVSEIRFEKAKRMYEEAGTEKLEQVLKYVPGVDANVAAIGESVSIEDAPKHGLDRSLAHPLRPKRVVWPSCTTIYFEKLWLKENPPQEGKPPK